MSRVREFKLPDLGEGLTEGEILKWLVAPGDVVRINDPIVEVETAKAAVEIPSPYAGVVLSLMHPEGTTVDVGAPIMSFDTDPGAGDPPVAGSDSAADSTVTAAAEDAVEGDPADPPAGTIGSELGGRTAILVGYGPKTVTAERRARKPLGDLSAPETHAASAAPMPTAGAVGPALAKPPVRKRARELGVDLASVHGSGPGGVVTRADLDAAMVGHNGADSVGAPVAPRRAAGDRPERRIPIKGVRKLTAASMVASAFTAPHVTEFMTVDITASMSMLTRLKSSPAMAGVKVTPMLLVANALLLAVRRNPEVNATWVEDTQEIVVKDYVNLGIAAATPRGLLVPNIKDADLLSLPELAGALQELTQTARDGKTSPADMSGGTITITNVGTFGVDTGTPIINPGESAILCFGAVRDMPWVHEGQIVIRKVTQLSLSFDHRNVDGALGSQVLADVGNALADPTRLVLW